MVVKKRKTTKSEEWPRCRVCGKHIDYYYAKTQAQVNRMARMKRCHKCA